MKFKVGFGFDIHPLNVNTDFWLGGIRIPHYKGASGHSNADTLIHSICDALFGAANLGDIGIHFPDTSNEYKGIDSKILLAKTVELVKKAGYSIGNIDITICLQKPKIAEYIPEMKKTLASVINIPESDISIKATTTEKLGFIGREEGIAVYAVVLIEKD
ncbi:MAG: 2-C-methyl-D-erythritol 2,4-cyclodiphosphate synthase [Bacteroidales bacterium]|jgi:2-C-methyl-D-erythritol 2,4-cyclodiphosphate synthase